MNPSIPIVESLKAGSLTPVVRALAVLGLMVSAAVSGAPATPAPGGLYLDYSARPSAQALVAHAVSIIDPAAEVDLGPAHAQGNTVLAYLSVVEAKPGSAYAKAAAEKGIPAIAGNAEWQTQVLDVTADGWADLVVKMATDAAAKGADGLFLDTVDSLQRIAQKQPGKAVAAREAVLALIKRLRQEFPAAKLVVNRGFELLDSLKGVVDGVLVESVYQTADAAGTVYQPVASETTAKLEKEIATARLLGMTTYAVDYVDPKNRELAVETARRLTELGCVPFITTPALQGLELAPLSETPRRVLVVFGWDPVFADKPATWPIDTLTAGTFQTFLEWMGYELDYLDIGKKPLPATLPPGYAAVILDHMLQPSPAQEERLASWLFEVKHRQIPVLFAGGMPFAMDEVKLRVKREFGMSGTLRSVAVPTQLTVRHMDEKLATKEIKVQPRKSLFLDVSAPQDARVFLSLSAQNHLGDEVRFDPIFLTNWGGMWLEPYITLCTSQDQRRFYADPMEFLQRWLAQAPAFPVADVTTKDGRRLFYSHIDGDGFTSLSQFPGHPTCAEVVRDRVLMKSPLPVTVSVIEAEIRGQLRSIKPLDAPRYAGIARSIFDLPHIQAASHSYCHPFQFDPNDPNPGHYELAHAPLNATADAAYPKIDPVREIDGSVEFINANLLPANKRVELFLWPGNTRPGVAALKRCRALGLENMNGGDTIISRIYPGVAGIAPRHCPWDDELQVFAANQNEFMYADGFVGPSFGGFASVIDTFELTAAPRRMKPVNVYYHFYSATYVSSLRALEKIMDWCHQQPLHPITAVEYARLVRDARDLRCYADGKGAWKLVTAGHLRTLRLPESSPLPDLRKSEGVTGWKTELGCHYVHTDGRPVVRLALMESGSTPAPHLHLAESSADLEFSAFQPGKMAFTVGGWNPAEQIILGGLTPKAQVALVVNGEPRVVTADSTGLLPLSLSPGSVVSLTVSDPAYVAQP